MKNVKWRTENETRLHLVHHKLMLRPLSTTWSEGYILATTKRAGRLTRLFDFPADFSHKPCKFQRRALRLAWLLVVVEAAGVVSLMNEGEFITPSSAQPENAFYVALCVIPIARALPNAFIFYTARGYFAEPERQ